MLPNIKVPRLGPKQGLAILRISRYQQRVVEDRCADRMCLGAVGEFDGVEGLVHVDGSAFLAGGADGGQERADAETAVVRGAGWWGGVEAGGGEVVVEASVEGDEEKVEGEEDDGEEEEVE